MLTASLGSQTDTFNCNRDSAYANEFPVAAEDLDVDKLKTTAQGAMGPYGVGGHETLLEGFPEYEPSLVISKGRPGGQNQEVRSSRRA